MPKVAIPWHDQVLEMLEDRPFQALGDARNYAVPSSKPGEFYIVSVYEIPEGRLVVCDPHCKGFRYRGTCAHIAAVP